METGQRGSVAPTSSNSGSSMDGLTFMCGRKTGRDTLRTRDHGPRPDRTAQGSSMEKINSHYIWLYKLVRVRAAKETAGYLPLKRLM